MDTTAAPAAAETPGLDQVKALEDRYLFPTYARVPILLERGKGPFVFDSAGKKYLDFITGIGVNAMGHAHPRILEVIRAQSKLLIHTSNLYYNAYQGPLAQRLTALAGMERAFFTVSGTEAVEGAIKAVRSVGQTVSPAKIEIVALNHSFHGRTIGAVSLTGRAKYRDPFGPMLPGVRFVDANDEAALAAAVNANTCAIFLEPVQGEGGIFELRPEFLAAAVRLAREHQALVVFDEIQCGLGRTGKMFAFQWTDCVPDLVVTAKPIAAGYPLGAIMARGPAATTLSSGLHGTTFGGGPLACRIALEVLDYLEDPETLANVQSLGALLKDGLLKIAKKHRFVKEVRGKGLMIGIELDRPAAPVFERMLQLGLLANVTHDTVIRLLPPYILTEAQIEKGLRIIAKALAAEPRRLPV